MAVNDSPEVVCLVCTALYSSRYVLCPDCGSTTDVIERVGVLSRSRLEADLAKARTEIIELRAALEGRTVSCICGGKGDAPEQGGSD